MQLYRQEKPDIVHHFTVKCVLYGTLAAHLVKIKSIVNSLTGLGYIFTGKRTFWRLPISLAYQILLRHTWTIFENPDDQALFLQRGWITPQRSITILGAGVDTDLFKPSPEPDGIPRIIFPARMLWDKGVGEFITAAQLLHKRNIQAKFILVGESDPGNPTGVPLQTLNKWNEEGLVEWWGWREDMSAIYAQANMICLPSYREGLPKTLIEAAASGRAIVTTDVPGCREVVSNGHNGFLIPPQDAPATANALELLINDPALRGRMGRHGRIHALQHFSLHKITAETLAYYQRIISTASK
jgi:glycosyltransferase involved in cell wall biosynthesis